MSIDRALGSLGTLRDSILGLLAVVLLALLAGCTERSDPVTASSATTLTPATTTSTTTATPTTTTTVPLPTTSTLTAGSFVVPHDLDDPVAEGVSRSSGGTPPPDVLGSVPGDDASDPFPLGTVTELPTSVRLDFLFELCPGRCHRDAHFLDPDESHLGSGPYPSDTPFHVKHGFVNNSEEPLGEGFTVTLYVKRLDQDVSSDRATSSDGPWYRYTPDYVVRGDTERCGPTYGSQTDTETCEWFVHEFDEGLPEGRHALWAVWEAPCSAWVDYGFAENCDDSAEVISLFSSGVDSPFGVPVPMFTERRESETDPDMLTRRFEVPLSEHGSDGAAGSGCTPGAEILPDGVWFGYITTRRDSEIDFDLACWYFGDAAYEKAIDAGEEPLEFWITNESPSVRTIPVSPDAIVWIILDDVSTGLHHGLYLMDWDGHVSSYTECPGESCHFWIYTEDGVITQLVEQYVP